MKIKDIIGDINSLKPNHYPDGDKIKWLSELDETIKHSFFDEYKVECDFDGYYDETDSEKELLAPDAFKLMYIHWLESKIDYWNGEYARFNNSIAMYNTVYQDFEAWWTSHHATDKKRFRW